MAVVINGEEQTPAPTLQGGVSFMRVGAEGRKATAAADAIAEALANATWRFYIGKNQLTQDFRVVFLDGDLDEAGMLGHAGNYREHMIQHAGKWQTFVCTEHGGEGAEPCPVCAGGDSPALVYALSIIDCNEYKKKDGGTIKNQRKMYIFKNTTLKILDKLAKKRGGLTGCVFDISRTTNKAARVGDMFDFVEKLDPDALREKFGKDDKGNWKAVPVNYGEAIPYYPAARLTEMGLGVPVVTIGGEAPASNMNSEL